MSPALFCLTDSLSMLCYASRPFKVVHLAFDMFIQMMYKLDFKVQLCVLSLGYDQATSGRLCCPQGFQYNYLTSWMFSSLIGHSQVMRVEFCLCNCSFAGSLHVFSFAPAALFRNIYAVLMQQGRYVH